MRGARRNIDAMDRVEGERKSVDLSGIELRVLELMRLGKTTKEIAATLCIPERTVELHIRHSLRRLQARSGEWGGTPVADQGIPLISDISG
jgi:DNA-binding NarL/FixJ family response regulator